MKSILVVLSIALSGIVTVGCGMGSSSNAGSCRTTDHRCIELGAGHSPTEYPAGCASPSTYSLSACTFADRVGHCVETAVVSGNSSMQTTHYYRPLTVAEARALCAMTAASLASNGGGADFTADSVDVPTDAPADAVEDARNDSGDDVESTDAASDVPPSDAGMDAPAEDASTDTGADVPASFDTGADVPASG